MSRAKHEDLGALGRLPAFEYWNDLVSVSTSLYDHQLTRWIGVWQRTVTGEQTPASWIHEITELWWGWASTVMDLGTFPPEWSWRRCMSTPSLVFAIDDAGQTTAPQSAPTAITAAGLTVGATYLQHVGGAERIDPSHVQVRLLERGNRVEVTLVDLGDGASAAGNTLPDGLYVGMAYAYDRPNLRPLALVYLYVDRSAPPVEVATG